MSNDEHTTAVVRIVKKNSLDRMLLYCSAKIEIQYNVYRGSRGRSWRDVFLLIFGQLRFCAYIISTDHIL